MPRVNRDLQRRLAARRERERRRPTERRYRFASVEPQDETELAANGTDAGMPTETGTQTVERPARAGRPDSARADRGVAPQTRTFSDYAAEYAYVLRDLRRVVAVVGSLLLVLIVLYFVLPH
ncbi:MAG: hypothetical protein JOZ81_33785 [Chloroflexi bacterium]|nr:hypothetical protein [Chloroflexota bacterium]